MAMGRAGRARPSRWRLRRRGAVRRRLDDEPEEKDTSCMTTGDGGGEFRRSVVEAEAERVIHANCPHRPSRSARPPPPSANVRSRGGWKEGGAIVRYNHGGGGDDVNV
uniref:Uncharacterized protein n=1 Tax=Oryza barthii TaxID=65489 RepID=A0A0D3FEQ7_9ORYZ